MKMWVGPSHELHALVGAQCTMLFFFTSIPSVIFGSYVDRNYVAYHLSSLLTEINYVPELLFDGLLAFTKGSPNMNSLVGFGAAFAISSVRIN